MEPIINAPETIRAAEQCNVERDSLPITKNSD